MSYEDKGTIGPTVVVSLEPDRSGNFVCDGASDDIEIQAAINYVNTLGSGEVHIKQGRYYISSKIDMTGMSNITIRGENKGYTRTLGTVLRAVSGLNDDILEIGQGGLGNPRLGITLTDLVFDHDGSNQTAGDCIEINTGYMLHFNNLTFWDSYNSAIDMNTVHESLFEDIIAISSQNDDLISLLISNGNTLIDFNISASAQRGVEIRNSDNNDLIGCDSYQNNQDGIFLVNGSVYNKIIGGQIHTNEYSGINIDADSSYNRVIGSSIHNNNQDGGAPRAGIEILNSFGGACVGNIISNNIIYDTQGTKTQDYAIREQNDAAENLISWNDLRGNDIGSLVLIGIGTQAHHNLVDGTLSIGTDVSIPTILGEFNQYGGGSAGLTAPVINTSPGGIDIDANDEFAATRFTLPEETQQVIRIVIWAYTNVLEADAMRLRIVAHGATDNEAWSGNAIDVADHPSESTNFAANDVIYWVIDASDDAQVGTLAASDYVELMAVGEAAGGADAATDALLGGFEIHYV